MPVIQTNIWICENCECISSKSFTVFPYDDPVVCPPNKEGWEFIVVEDKELLCCPECVKKLGN